MINSLYVHIPFCVQKCLYCDFNSYTNLNLQNDYIKALEKELSSISQDKFKTIFVGGGTPTILSLDNLEKLLIMLEKYKAKEYTFECNPGTLSVDKLNLMKKYGVNRLSIGLQAVQDSLLKRLGRIHNMKHFMESYKNAREVGFHNINIDLMFGIPDQTLEDWKESIKIILELRPEHISCYSLIVEEGTPFYQMYENDSLNLVDENTEREMYYYAVYELKKHGYYHYEISNFSLKEHECNHNITYWQDEEYYGIGAGAHSYTANTRYSNYPVVEDYIKKINSCSGIEVKTNLTRNDELSEFMFLGLRMISGISKANFQKRFCTDIYSEYNNDLRDLINASLLIDDGENVKLTPRGIDVSNQVFVRFLK